jgi:hypothetical protein
VNILDEAIGQSQCRQLHIWKLHFRQIGFTIGRSGMQDREDVIPLLHGLKRPTFFTLDHGFYHPSLRHPGYCLVFLDVWENEVADYMRRLLRHAELRTQAQRMGKVVRVRHGGIRYWQMRGSREQPLQW